MVANLLLSFLSIFLFVMSGLYFYWAVYHHRKASDVLSQICQERGKIIRLEEAKRRMAAKYRRNL